MNLPKLRWILPLTAILSSGSALAAIDCTTLAANTAGFVGYKQQGATDITSLNLLKKPVSTSICGIKINSNSNSYSVQAKDIPTLSRLFGGSGSKWPLMMISLSSIGGEPGLTEAATLSITFPPESNKGIRIGGSFSGNLSPYSEIIVRVNDSKLQTLLKDVRFTALYFDPKTTKKLDLYVKTPDKLTWTRATLDIKAAKMTFYKTSAYPAK